MLHLTRPLDRDPRLAPPEQLARVILSQHQSLLQHRQAVAIQGLIHLVRADEQGDPLGGQLLEVQPKGLPQLRVDPGGRLVEEQDLGLVHQRARQRDALLHPA